ncbi:MAG: glycoside hydrolase family 15 protein [Candidatus Latescibacterota bacterium]
MPRDIPVSNGNLLVAFDKEYRIRDLYFPFVGEENQTAGNPFRLGFRTEEQFSWVDGGWNIRLEYLDDSLVTNVRLENPRLGIRVVTNDLVDFHENIFLRRMVVVNDSDHPREIRVFFHHDFCLYGNEIGDTAAFRPEVRGLLHYKGERYFLVNLKTGDETGIRYFATGSKRTASEAGTWKDAEDGELGGNPIAQGSVDSVAAVHLDMEPGGARTIYYWICAGKNWEEVAALNQIILEKTPEVILKRTFDYWYLWIHKEGLNFDLLPAKIARLYRRSMLIIRTQIDNRGGITAANDSDTVNFNRDTYSYVWPRDGSLVAYALDLAGYFDLTRSFFQFCGRVLTGEGYFLHKYTPSGNAGSSWHPWYRDGVSHIPIQEDETAIVVWALWNHFLRYHDIEFIKPLYRPLIINCADFMLRFRHPDTGLPFPTYDLWEEQQGIHTFTVSTVYIGLLAAASFAMVFGEREKAEAYRTGAEEIKQAMLEHLFLPDEGRFARLLRFDDQGQLHPDRTIDASMFAVFAFHVLDPNDPRVESTMRQVHERLWCPTTGGVSRYEGDQYHRVAGYDRGNPWSICTIWFALYHIHKARNRAELDEALPYLEWVADHALPSGVLAEQVHPFTNEPLSVSPLTWSHAAFVTSVQEYLDKLLSLEECPSCGQPKYSREKSPLLKESPL